MSTFLVDSDVLIWTIRRHRGVEQALAQVVETDADLLPALSAVTAFEALQGMRAGEEARHEEILGQLECLPVTGAIAELAAAMWRDQRTKGRTMNLGDALIAGTALCYDLVIVTYNRRHFEPLGIPVYDGLPAIESEG